MPLKVFESGVHKRVRILADVLWLYQLRLVTSRLQYSQLKNWNNVIYMHVCNLPLVLSSTPISGYISSSYSIEWRLSDQFMVYFCHLLDWSVKWQWKISYTIQRSHYINLQCNTEDQNNGCWKFSSAITVINCILKYIEIEKKYF